MESRQYYINHGLLVGFLMPGISQALAQRMPEGIIWLTAVVLAWWHLGLWALVIHLLSSWRTAALMDSAFAEVLKQQTRARTCVQRPLQTR